MSDKLTGGLAFPIVGTHEEVLEIGMTLRDYFAAKALPALVQMAYTAKNVRAIDDSPVTEDTIAVQAYYFADAMLKAREQ